MPHHLINGKCREKVEIPATMAYITLEGAGVDKTIIEWDDTADRMDQSGRPLGTYGSATFAINSPGFVAKNITFKVCYRIFCFDMWLFCSPLPTFTCHQVCWKNYLVESLNMTKRHRILLWSYYITNVKVYQLLDGAFTNITYWKIHFCFSPN